MPGLTGGVLPCYCVRMPKTWLISPTGQSDNRWIQLIQLGLCNPVFYFFKILSNLRTIIQPMPYIKNMLEGPFVLILPSIRHSVSYILTPSILRYCQQNRQRSKINANPTSTLKLAPMKGISPPLCEIFLSLLVVSLANKHSMKEFWSIKF